MGLFASFKRYIGYIVFGEKIVALIIIDGNALAVEKGEMISEGVKVGEITPEEIEIMGPDSEKRKYSLEGKRSSFFRVFHSTLFRI